MAVRGIVPVAVIVLVFVAGTYLHYRGTITVMSRASSFQINKNRRVFESMNTSMCRTNTYIPLV